MIGKKGNLGLAIAAVMGMSSSNIFDPSLEKTIGWVGPDVRRRGMGPSGSPKRNQERSIKRQAQRSRVINRMRRK